MIICIHCRHENLEGSLICSQCSQLLGDEFPTPAVTHKYRTSDLVRRDGYYIRIGTNTIKLILSPQQFYQTRVLLQGGRLILGRQQSAPDVTMLPIQTHNAAELGVSRQHVALIPTAEGIAALDLGSTNGSSLNGQPMVTGQLYLLTDGDHLQLGQLVLEVQLA